MTDAAIVARGLVRRFGSFTAVDGIDLDVPRASVYGFLGPNGSGKSTTIRMLCGLLTPTEGEVEVLGMRVPRDVERLRPRVGYMTQKFSLYEDLSVRENLEFMGQVFVIPRAEIRTRVDSILRRFGIFDRADVRTGSLSGGQKQHVALAAATLHDPELLILDEPTSAVDPESRRRFWEFLFDLVGEGKTILVSSHFMDEAERCHHLAILDEGRLVATGVPDQLTRDIGVQVVEVEAGHTRAVRRALLDSGVGLHVSQLGAKLHVLVPQAQTDPVEAVRAVIRRLDPGLEVRVRVVEASLEDVFVMATADSH